MKQLFRYQLEYDLKVSENEYFAEYCAIMVLKTVDVLKETKHSYVIKDHNGKVRRIFKDSQNTYAHENKDAALRCFYHRTKKYCAILRGKSEIIKELLKKVEVENKEIIS